MHYAFQDDHHLHIVMDACMGGDLHYQLTQAPRRRFGEEQAKFYAASIVLALEYMHRHRILHRDIKPGVCSRIDCRRLVGALARVFICQRRGIGLG